MGEFLGPYRDLEVEIADESIDRFVRENQKNAPVVAPDFSDPRSVRAFREAESAGFSLEEGQYVDLLNGK